MTESNIVMTVEIGWYERIKNTTIYRYKFPTDTFKVFDEFAGYYISTETIIPIKIKPLDNLIERLMDLNIELRYTPNLNPLRNALINSTITDFGIHRFANAKK